MEKVGEREYGNEWKKERRRVSENYIIIKFIKIIIKSKC